MKIHSDKSQESKKSIPAKTIAQKKTEKSSPTITDNRLENVGQKKFQKKLKSDASDTQNQTKKNKTGLPDNLKSGVENLSGYSMDNVKVHYNSDKPAQLNAHAYAQGTEIHLASGQEKHLPHEAWHVVQQKQGRVKPTMQMMGKTLVNDDADLEKEADLMGKKALQTKKPLKNDKIILIDSSSVEHDSHFYKSNQPISNTSKNITQLTAENDARDAMTNRNHLDHETFPGLATSLNNVIGDVQDKIDNYSNAHLAAQDPPANHVLSQSASGLKTLTQNIMEQSDAKWAEAGLMEDILNAHANNIPVPARNNQFDPDIELSDANNGGAITGYEVKAVNSDAVGAATVHINDADAQLGNRNANRGALVGANAALRPALAQSKILIWIAHQDNHWPGMAGFAGRVNNAQIIADVNGQLNGMALAHATSIKIQMLRTPAGHPSAGKALDVLATRVNVGAAWNSVITKHWP